MKIQFRSGMAADLAALVLISRRIIAKNYASFLGVETADAFLRSGAVEDYLSEHLHHSIVIVRDDTVVGYSVSRADLIDLMMINASDHRQGLGSALLLHVEDVLFREYQTLKLESFLANNAANSFYRKNGWRETGAFTEESTGIEKMRFQKSR